MLLTGSAQQPVPEPTQRTFRKRSRSRGQSLDRHLKLTAEQKCDIATRELEELREAIERMKEVAEKKLDNFRVSFKPRYHCRSSPVDECTFCITFSFKAEGYTESTLIHRG